MALKHFATSIPLSILRFFQFASSALVMSLLAYAISDYGFHGSKKTNFALAVGVISVFYLLWVFLGTMILPQAVFPGIFFIFEVVVMLLWLCAFIVIAKAIGQNGCHNDYVNSYNPAYGSYGAYENSNGYYNPYTGQYGSNSHRRACNSSKAAIAFAGLAFVLFVISCIVMAVKVLAPIWRRFGSRGLWMSGPAVGAQLQRSTGLALRSPLGGDYGEYDEENKSVGAQGVVAAAPGTTGTGVPTASMASGDQHTYSTGESTNNNGYTQEKYMTNGSQDADASRMSGVTGGRGGVPDATTAANTHENAYAGNRATTGAGAGATRDGTYVTEPTAAIHTETVREVRRTT